MKKSILKGFSLCIALTILIAGLGSCGNKNSDANDNSDSLSFSVYHPIFSKSPSGTATQTKWQEMMEKYLGVKLDIEWRETSYSDYLQKQQVYVASNDYADVFLITPSPVNTCMQLGESGFIVNLNDYKENLTHYSRFLNNGSERKKIETDDGKLYGFLNATIGENSGTQYLHVFRTDVFKENNIPVPNTLEEYYETAKTLKRIYPDSYPITGFGSPETFVAAFAALNHTNLGIYYNGSEYVYGPVADEQRLYDITAYLKKLYGEKLLDPEFLTQSDDQTMQKMLGGKAFMVPCFMGTRINQYINNNQDGIEWGVMPEPNNLYDEVSWKFHSNSKGMLLSTSGAIVISSKAQNPGLLTKLIDYQYSDEMIELANWGIEGKTFVNDGSGRSYTDEIMNAENPQLKLAEYGVNQSMSIRSGIQFMPIDCDSATKLLSPVPVYKDGEYYEDNFWSFTSDLHGDASVSPNENKPPVMLSAEETDSTNVALTSLLTYVQENILSFIAGTKDISEWSSFISGLKSVGDYEYVVKLYNEKR